MKLSNGDLGGDWDDWNDEEEEQGKIIDNIENTGSTENNQESIQNQLNKIDWGEENSMRGVDITSNVAKLLKNVEELDIMKLDVKVSTKNSAKLKDGCGDIDYFADMTPQIIRKASSLDKFEAQLKSNSGAVS